MAEESKEEKAELRKKIAEERALRAQKKKMYKRIALGVVAFLAILAWYGLQPLRAGMNYGICKTFVETRIRYPRTYKVQQYDEYGNSIRLFYTHVDEYGGTRSEMIECVGNPDPVNGFVMTEVKINRESISPEELARINMAIPGIMKAKPDTVIPRPTPEGDLNALKRDE